MAYDEGLVKGDAVLAAAIWRNLFKAREDIDVRTLASIVSWVRSQLKYLDAMDDAGLALHPTLFKSKADAELPVVDELVPALEQGSKNLEKAEAKAAAAPVTGQKGDAKGAQKTKAAPRFKSAA